MTMALLPGSPAIDKGSNALTVDPQGNPLQFDQRGTGFVRVFNGKVDIGAYEYLPAGATALSVEWGSAGAAMLQSAADGVRLLPLGRNTDLPWTGIDKLPIELGQARVLTAADMKVSGVIGVNYKVVLLSGAGTSYTITLAPPINKADRITITIGVGGLAPFTRRLDVLPGDFNDDGVVNSQDLVGVRNQWLGFNGAKPTIFGDINGDVAVNVQDYNAVRAVIGTTLPSASGSGGSLAGGLGIGAGASVVRIGTSHQPPQSTGPGSRAAAEPSRPRAEIQLASRGRSWSLGAPTKVKVIGQASLGDR
jgi:hypothetical protein